MPPALLLLGWGRDRRVVVPLPVLLLWPFMLAAWTVLALAWLIMPGHYRPRGVVMGLTALRALVELRGTRVDLEGRDGSISLRFV